MPKYEVYVDGSFNQETKLYGAGVVVLENGVLSVQNGFEGSDPLFVKHRNVAGEVYATQIALAYCKQQMELNKTPASEMDVTVYHDYAGIECWPAGRWRAQNTMTIQYKQFVTGLPFKVKFSKVKAHTGNTYNEMADQWAKRSIGLI